MASGSTLPPQAYTREILASAFNWLQAQPESTKKLAQSPDALVGLYLRAQRYGQASLETDAPVSSQNFISDLKNLAEGLKQFESPKDAEVATRTLQKPMNANARPSQTTVARSAQLSQTTMQEHGPHGSAFKAAYQASQTATQTHTAVYHSSVIPEAPATYTPNLAAVSQANSTETSAHPGAGYASNQTRHNYDHHEMHTPQFFNPHPVESQSAQMNYQTQAPTNATMGSSPASSFNGTSAASPSTNLQTLHLKATTIQMIQEVKGQLNLSSDAEALNMMVSIAYKNLKSLLT